MHREELDAHRRVVRTRSGEISYIDIGTGPVALFVHGIATNAYLWRNVIGALARPGGGTEPGGGTQHGGTTRPGGGTEPGGATPRRCIALDLPLHGQTPVTAGQDLSVASLASVVEDFCDALELVGIDLVANDTGGAIAQVFAARNPKRLATLTLTNCDTAENMPPEAFKPTAELAAAGALAPAAVTLLDDVDAARDLVFGSTYEYPERVPPEIVRAYLEPCFGTLERARQFERMIVALDPGDLRAVEPQLRVLMVPTLVVWGTGDVFFDVSWAHWLRDTIPGVTRVVTVDGARLFFPEERAAELVGPLAQHWAEHRD
jgi:pimeloyl-ACP methyl ester carboxylesterase